MRSARPQSKMPRRKPWGFRGRARIILAPGPCSLYVNSVRCRLQIIIKYTGPFTHSYPLCIQPESCKVRYRWIHYYKRAGSFIQLISLLNSTVKLVFYCIFESIFFDQLDCLCFFNHFTCIILSYCTAGLYGQIY